MYTRSIAPHYSNIGNVKPNRLPTCCCDNGSITFLRKCSRNKLIILGKFNSNQTTAPHLKETLSGNTLCNTSFCYKEHGKSAFFHLFWHSKNRGNLLISRKGEKIH